MEQAQPFPEEVERQAVAEEPQMEEVVAVYQVVAAYQEVAVVVLEEEVVVVQQEVVALPKVEKWLIQCCLSRHQVHL